MALDFGKSLFSKEGEKREAIVRDNFTVGDIGSDSQGVLEINSTSTTAQIKVTAETVIQQSNYPTDLQVKTYHPTTFGSKLTLFKARGTIKAPVNPNINDTIGTIDVCTHIDNTFVRTTAIKFKHKGNTGDPNFTPSTSIHLETSTIERIRIDELGQTELICDKAALLLNRLTTTNRDALTGVNGMLIYNSTLNKFQGYENGAWVSLV